MFFSIILCLGKVNLKKSKQTNKEKNKGKTKKRILDSCKPQRWNTLQQ